jgi:eukaryotic-like serine/threonine-protein kinase
MPLGGAAECARKAYDMREKVSERERFQIEALHYYANGEDDKATQTVELWQQTYPRDDMPYGLLGAISAMLGNWENALEEMLEALRLQPNSAGNYIDLGVAYTALNRLDEADAVYKQAEEHKWENEQLLQNRYVLAFLMGNRAEMAQLASAAMGKAGSEALLLATQADTEGWYGKLKDADELTRRAMDSALHNDAKESAAAYQVVAALREVESGNRDRARAYANAALKLDPQRDVSGGGTGVGACRRYGKCREAGRRTRQNFPAGYAGPEVLATHRSCSRRLGAQRPGAGSRTIRGGEDGRTWPTSEPRGGNVPRLFTR